MVVEALARVRYKRPKGKKGQVVVTCMGAKGTEDEEPVNFEGLVTVVHEAALDGFVL